MNIFAVLIIILSVTTVHSEGSDAKPYETPFELLKNLVTKDLTREWDKKLGDRFLKIASFSKKFNNHGNFIKFVLTSSTENQNKTEAYLNDITSDQFTLLDSNISQFPQFMKYLEDLAGSKLDFEYIISTFTSNSTSLLNQLDQYTGEYKQQGSDTKLVNILDSGAGISNSIVDDLILLSRSDHKDKFVFYRSSTLNTFYEVYITAFIAILKGNLILESAVNLKTTVTGQYYEEDRRYNHFRKNEIFERFFTSLKKVFSKLNDNDMDEYIDLTINGNQNRVRMINVLQIFWENEDKLSIIDTCTDDCGTFKDRKYTGGGCYGSVKDCKFAVSLHHTERYLRQNPQVDRIYEGYVLNNKWYGHGIDEESDPNMELKKSYLRGFVNCHVCKCVCDQDSNSDSVRKIYSGKISAPDGYVVTGIRFVESNKAIYPQIQVGKLLPMATIDQSSVYFLEIPADHNFIIFDYNKHKIEFGDPVQIGFSDAFVTGVQFQSSYIGASWSIYGREIVDFNRGILGNEVIGETRGSLVNFDASDLIPGLSSGTKFTIGRNRRVEFGISNEDEDAGQSFVPYFDGNEVTFDIKSPLSGITLIHYTNDAKYAGFIRPVLRSLDYRKLFSTSYQVQQFTPLNLTDHEDYEIATPKSYHKKSCKFQNHMDRNEIKC